MTSRTQIKRTNGVPKAGFTFLELLLALVLLSMAAAMAFPRLSGFHGRLKYDRQKDSIRRLALHAERLSGLTGEYLLLTWDQHTSSLLLLRVDDRFIFGRSAPHRVWRNRGDDIRADAFYEFAHEHPDLRALESEVFESPPGFRREQHPRSFAGASAVPVVSALSGAAAGFGASGEDAIVIDRCLIDAGIEVQFIGFPVLFGPDRRDAGALIRIMYGDRIDELVVSPYGIAPAWKEGPGP